MPALPASNVPVAVNATEGTATRAARPRKSRPPFGPNIVAAVLCAIVAMAYAGSFGQLVFDGQLSPFVGFGILTAMISSVTVLLAYSWRSSFPFSVGGPDSNPSAILAVTLASIAAEIVDTGGAKSPELFPTVMMYVFVSATGCGLLVRLLGGRGGGRYVRYLPHPVTAGFLAGTGYLLVAGAFRGLTGTSLRFESLAVLAKVNPLAGVTTIVVAVALLVLSRRVRHYMVIPGVIVGAVLAFHAARVLLGLDLAAAQSAGMLLPRLEISGWQSVGTLNLSDVRWDLILFHGKDFAAMTIVVVVATLLNTTSIELASGRDGDADRELRAIGISNVLAGIFGGMVACNSFNRTLLNLRAGANSPWAARLAAGIILVVMLVAPGAVGWLPRPVLIGLIFFLGVNLLITWVIESYRTLTRMDYAVMLAILGIVMAFGMVAGVISGVFIACVTLAVTLSRSPNVRYAFTLENRRANVERGPDQIESLRLHGAKVRGYSLQGVLFFGTASRLLDAIRRGLSSTSIVLLDFRLVQGADGSSIVMFRRLQTVCKDAGVRMVFTGLNSRMASQLTRGGLELGSAHVRRFADLDRGLEWCEEFVLGQAETPRTLTEVLEDALTRVGCRLLLELGEHRQIPAGAVLVRQGDPSNEMYFIESGRLQVSMKLDAAGGDSKRLRSYGPGSMVGEMGFFSGEPRSADIVAEKEAQVFCLSRERMTAIENDHPALARALHRHVIAVLSQRVRSTNDEIRQLV